MLQPFGSWGHFKHAIGLLARHARDRLGFKRGTRLIMGNGLLGRLLYDLKRLAVEIRYRAALKDLVKVDDEIVGAVLTTPAGEHALRARKGVILATGGDRLESRTPQAPSP